MGIDVTEARDEFVGAMRVRRSLPMRQRRTIGAWCFADHMGPASVDENKSADVGPHPHMGLSTVTWLLDGQLLHKDSLGSEQVIKAGQVNLMQSGFGVTHAEEATGHFRGTLEGIQLWLAQPEASRNGPAAFQHIEDLPMADLGGGQATVLVGSLAGAASPARSDTAIVGAELALHGPTTLPLDPAFEHGLIVLRGMVQADGQVLKPGTLGYLARGKEELHIDVREPATVMLVGGEPFESPIFMWWNFVGRNRAEIDEAYDAWERNDGRFGRVDSTLPRIAAKPPFWR